MPISDTSLPNFSSIEPVAASEEEEEDIFDVLPTHRWHNESIDSGSIEALDNGYFVNTTNPSASTMQFAKSRALNTRDFYFETRFLFDNDPYYSYQPTNFPNNSASTIYHLKFDEQSSGTGETYDSSIYARNIEETWNAGHFDTPSYNDDANHTVFMNNTFFEIDTDDNLGDISENFTLGYWIYVDDIEGTTESIIKKQGWYESLIRNYSVTDYEYKFIFRTALGGESASVFKSNTNVTEDTWYFVAFTYNNVTNTGKIYINGTLDSTDTGNYWQDFPYQYNATVRMIYENIFYNLDDIFYINSTLSDSEIEDFYTYMPNGSVLTETEFDIGRFKFSLLGESDHVEHGYFEFQYHNATTYNFTVEFYGAPGGEDLIYSQLYSYTQEEWLRLKVKINLNKKKVDVDFLRDDNTDIFDGNLYALFDTVPRDMPTLFTMADYPRLCMNNSQLPYERNSVIVDFIDAPWLILDWSQPLSTPWTVGDGILKHTLDQEPDRFTSTSPYGMFYEGILDDYTANWFQLDIDRFDGMSWNVQMETGNWEDYDQERYYWSFYNVQPNGSLIKAIDLYFILAHYGAVASQHWRGWIYHEDGSVKHEIDYSTGAPPPSTSSYEVEHSFAIYADYGLNKIVFQGASDSYHLKEFELSTNWTTTLTREFVFREGYRIWDSDGTDVDIMRIRVGEFDVVRKDLFSGIVGAILDPIIGFIQWLFTPLTVTLLFLAAIFKQIGPTIFGLFEGFLDAVSGLLSGIQEGIESLAAGIWTAFESVLGDLLSELQAVATDIWNNFSSALGDILTDIGNIGDFVITALLDELGALAADLLDALLELGTALQELQQMLIQFIIDEFILGFLDDMFTELGLGWLFDWIISVITDVGTLILGITQIIIVWLSFIIDLLLILSENLELIGLMGFALWAGWLVLPLMFFLSAPFEDWFSNDGISVLEDLGSRVYQSVILLYNMTKGMIEFIMRIVSTIGNYIPFT